MARSISRSAAARTSSSIGDKIVTYDFARLMEGAREVKCSEFATAIIEHM